MPEPIKKAVKTALWLHVAGVLFTVTFVTVAYLTRDAERFRLGACWIRESFHVYCPGCGATRGVFALLLGHPIQAFLAYPTLFLALGLILYADTFLLFAVFSKKERYLSYIRWKLFLLLPICAVLWAVLRTVLVYTVGFDPLGDLAGI